MYHRGALCAHCAEAEAEEPCPRCRQTVCISCLLDRAPCRDVRHRLAMTRSVTSEALDTLSACGVQVAGERLVTGDVPLWQIESVRVAPLGDPVPGRPDIVSLTVQVRSGYRIEVMRRAESAAEVEDVYLCAEALARLAGTEVTYLDGESEIPSKVG